MIKKLLLFITASLLLLNACSQEIAEQKSEVKKDRPVTNEEVAELFKELQHQIDIAEQERIINNLLMENITEHGLKYVLDKIVKVKQYIPDLNKLYNVYEVKYYKDGIGKCVNEKELLELDFIPIKDLTKTFKYIDKITYKKDECNGLLYVFK